MNNIIQYAPPPPPSPQGMVPQDLSQAIKLAELMSTSKLVPKDLQKSASDCLMVIMQAVRWEMDPFAVAQECSVIQGKLMYSGKLVAAVVNARGNLEDRLSFTFEGTGDNRVITVSGRMRGEIAARTVSVAIKDARTNAVVWQKQPDQQLAYHGTRVWARRHAPELVLGVWAPEEFDTPVTKPEATEVSPIQPEPIVAPAHDPQTGELGPHEIPLPTDKSYTTDWGRWIGWGQLFIAAIKTATTLADFDQWGAKNHALLVQIKNKAPKVYDRIKANMQDVRARIPEASGRKGKKQAPDVVGPEEHLAHIEAMLGACTTPEELGICWNDRVAPTLGELFPPDADVAKEMFERRLKTLEKA